MTENKNIFLVIFNWIVNCYDHSLFEKMISGFFGFFTKNSPNSVIIDFFKNHFSSGRVWQKSHAAAVVRSPFAVCRRFYHRHEGFIEDIKSKSGVLNFLCSAGKIPLRDYGTIFLALGVGMSAGIAFFVKWDNIVYIALTAGVYLTGAILCLSEQSFRFIAAGSRIILFMRRTVSQYDSPVKPSRESTGIQHLIAIWVLALVIGCFMFAFEPIAVIGGLFGAAIVILILWRTEIGVFLFVPLSAILPTMALIGLVGLTLVSFILHLLLSKRAEYISTPFQAWIAVFLGLSVYSALTSTALASSLQILMVYVVFTMAYTLIVNTVKDRSHWTALVILFVAAAVIIALYGIFQNFFLQSTTQSWVDEEMFTEIKKRVYSTLDNPNVLGEYFILLIPMAFALFLKMYGGLRKSFYAACNFIMFACLMYTWSRGAWLGVVLGLVFFLLLKDRRWLVVCVAGLLIMPSVLPAGILERLTSIGNVKDSSTAYRVAVWIGSLRMLKDYWFCGIGLGPDAFLEIYPQYALGGAGFALHSHNFYLQWMVDMGFVGLFVYLGIIVTGFKQIASVVEKNTLIKNILLAMSGALLGYLLHGMAENLWYNYRMILVFWIYFGILQSGVIIAGGVEQRKDVLK